MGGGGGQNLGFLYYVICGWPLSRGSQAISSQRRQSYKSLTYVGQFFFFSHAPFVKPVKKTEKKPVKQEVGCEKFLA